MHHVSGGCHCGRLRAELQLTRAPAAFTPRACDCSFCRKHGAAYVSDPQGVLRLRIADESLVTRYRQGSGLAELLICSNCGVLVGALYAADGVLYGVVNATALDDGARFGTPQPVSPRTLLTTAKVTRWQEIWFSNVSIIVGHAAAAAGGQAIQHE
jgi:hypothetical protein